VTTSEQDARVVDLRPDQAALRSTQQLTCVEVGASSTETVLLDGPDLVHREAAPIAPLGRQLLIAVPGLVLRNRVVAASNLGWYDVDPAERLGLGTGAALVCNDAEAAAVGESVLRPGSPDLVFVGLGTGIGGALVRGGRADANLLAHGGRFGERECACGLVGCLETVAGGWALPSELSSQDLRSIALNIAAAIRDELPSTPELVVLAGGLTAAHPVLIQLLADALPEREVQGTAAPGTKSAAAWGLRHLYTTDVVSLPEA
jgi:glucokinase